MKQNPKSPPRMFFAYGEEFGPDGRPGWVKDWRMVELRLNSRCRNFRSVKAIGGPPPGRNLYSITYVRVHEATPEQVAAWALGWRPPKDYRRP